MTSRMYHLRRLKISILFFYVLISPFCQAGIGCTGKITNPITDVCWKCLFPIKIGGIEVVSSDTPDTPNPTDFPVCFCKRPGFPAPLPGIPISFWEPARLIDVTKSPMCMVSLGGISLGTSPQSGTKDDQDGSSFYHVHWYIYPVLYWLELLMDFACLEMVSVDVAYLTEFDPFWNDDTKSAILNPEAILFGNIIAQGACIADCLTASVGLSNDLFFWCSGCQGSLYPYTGNVGAQNGGVQGSSLLVGRMIAKLHRELLAWGYYGNKGLCGKYPLPIIKKSQYRYQMTYPIPEVLGCKRIGQTEVLWQSGKEFPVKGEDFAYLLWRKRDCCLL